MGSPAAAFLCFTASSSIFFQVKFSIRLSSFAQQEVATEKEPLDLSIMSINGNKISLQRGMNIISLRYNDGKYRQTLRLAKHDLISTYNVKPRSDLFSIPLHDATLFPFIVVFNNEILFDNTNSIASCLL